MAIINALPENLQALFAPRPPLPYIPVPEKRKNPPYSGFATYADLFEQPEESKPKYTGDDYLHVPTREQKQRKKERLRKQKAEDLIRQQEEHWKPKEYSGDPFHTIFVARLNYETTEETLKKEFEYYGPVKSLTIVKDINTGKSRGYGFIEYEREKHMKSAYKEADGIRIDGRRVLVDMERARTTKDFRPRRLGGGLGSTRKSKLPKHLLPPPPKPAARPYRPSGPPRRGGGRDRGGRRDSYQNRDRGGSYRGPGRRNDRYDDRRNDSYGGRRNDDRGRYNDRRY